jgi:hypothetical protein
MVITSKKLVFKENSTNGWTVMCRENGNKETMIHIPTTVFSEEFVTRIAHESFQGDVFLEEVKIPSTVEKIGHSAFEECHHLRTLNFGAGLRAILIRKNAFWGCDKLITISVDRNTILEQGAFANCKALKRVGGNFTSVAAEAFSGCSELESVCFKRHVTIADDAFSGCNKLSMITFEQDVVCSKEFIETVLKNVKIRCPVDSKLAELVYSGYNVELI